MVKRGKKPLRERTQQTQKPRSPEYPSAPRVRVQKDADGKVRTYNAGTGTYQWLRLISVR